MRERVGQRLAELRAEYAAGQKTLADLDANRAEIQETLLRISGAIQVLEELLVAGVKDGEEEVDGGASGFA